jgi:hypothetical protein
LQTIKRDDALIAKTKEQIRIKKVKLNIARNEAKIAAHAASRWARKALDFSEHANKVEVRIKVRQSQIDVEVARIKNQNEENRGLVKLLKQINLKLRSYGLTSFNSVISACFLIGMAVS